MILQVLPASGLTKKNRMIFEADEYQITIIQCGEHYKDH